MKTEKQIRAHLGDLQVCHKKPCGCAESQHELPCYIGGMMMQAAIDTIRWILDEDAGELDRLVEEMAKGSRS